MKKNTINKSFLLYLLALLLWLSFDSCSKKPTPEEEKEDIEVSDSDNDYQQEDFMSNDTILHKTKAQYVIY